MALTDEQLDKLKRIWATDRCPKRQEFRILGTERMKQHFISFRGSVGHRMIEAELADEELDLDRLFEPYPEARDYVLDYYSPITENLRVWIETTDIDLSEAEPEVKFEKNLRLGYVLVRKIDILTPTHILDLKFGKRRNDKDSRMDLAISWDVVRMSGEGERDPDNLGLIFLGGDEPVELFPFQHRSRGKQTPIGEAVEAAEKQIDETIFFREMIRGGEAVPCRFGIWCGTCYYRGVCDGYPPWRDSLLEGLHETR